MLSGMDTEGFWQLLDRARTEAGEDGEAVATRAAELLAQRPAAEIIAAHGVLREQMARSYVAQLWAAGYVINGGCSDDGFEYFRGWLIIRGREVFERALIDPDSLAELSEVQAAAAAGNDLECELALNITNTAYRQVTGEELLPAEAWHGSRYPDLGGEFWFNFEDGDRLGCV
jgi:hypothetical protein